MPRALNLAWKSPTIRLTPTWRLGLAAVAIALATSVVFWWQASELLDSLQRKSAQHDQLRATRVVSFDMNRGELREELTAVNQMIRQLNQQWDVLLANVQPTRPSVRLLAVEVDAKSQKVRLVGHTARVAEMIDYVAALNDRSSVKGASLVRHEVDRESGGYRFVVEAQWADGR